MQSKANVSDNPSLELLLHYTKGEVSEAVREAIQAKLAVSEAWRQELKVAEAFVSGMQALPKKAPRPHVWDAVSESVASVQPRQVWFPWFYANPAWPAILRFAPVCVLVLLTGWYYLSAPAPVAYEVLVVEDSNGFGKEAESYVVHHDLSVEPSMTRETLIAYYAYDWNE